jgi:hypothetical protein
MPLRPLPKRGGTEEELVGTTQLYGPAWESPSSHKPVGSKRLRASICPGTKVGNSSEADGELHRQTVGSAQRTTRRHARSPRCTVPMSYQS